ncbi:MAG: NAD(P)H-dependent oxidoreductase subunit E [Phycisphaerales bacterium]|nr:MAG: NAD(P)H-dependent oxidoreductase subunit E [Phycisphaerales bacterium]
MSRKTYKTIALLLGISGVAVVTVCIAWLIAVEISANRREPVEKARLETLVDLSDEEPAELETLYAERDRQTQSRLQRTSRVETASYVLIVSAVLFLVGFKWFVALRGRRLPDINRVNPQRAGCKGGNNRPVLKSGTCPSAGAPCDAQEAAPADLSFVDQAIKGIGRGPEAVIPILNAIQGHYHYLPEAALRHVCQTTEITPAQITGVASFYNHFRRMPGGRHSVKVCHGTACHVAGAQNITDEIRRYLRIDPGQDTDAERLFTVEKVACLGCCTLAPVVQIDGITYGHLTPDTAPAILEDFLAQSESEAGKHDGRPIVKLSAADKHGEIRVGLGSCCVAGGSGKVYTALQQALSETNAAAAIKRVGCVGMCHRTPLVEAITPDGTSSLYAGVNAADAKAIVRRHFKAPSITKRIGNAASALVDDLLSDHQRRFIAHHSIEVRDPPVAAFLGPQKHIATEHCGRLDPTDLDEYIRLDGFQAFERCVKELAPEQVIQEIERSGLRGRGGAGFPTARKWARVCQAGGELKYVVCNGDEGDPGAFMDRMLMESFPYRIIEGMAIAAYAVGAENGYFYIRAEYPLAVQRISEAILECERRNILGDNILGTHRKLRLRIMQGAGAFVCGEETALLASIEGRRGSPRLRPPYPAENGLWGKPTLVNNVETYAAVPWIIRHAAEAFAALGTATSKGTKVFALAGKIKRGGLIEVPMGITIRQIVEEIGGGIKEDRRFKAVQIGGPSGGCIPAYSADTPIDFDALTHAGAIMGSGGLVVLDETDCMVDIAHYFLSFTQNQSCGKCTFCRIGTRRMLDILERLRTGQGRRRDLESLEALAHSVKHGSLCGLGRTAPNPVLTTLRYFHDEYEAHLEGRCPAGKCPALITYRVTDACTGCTLCAQHCPAEAIAFTPYVKHEIDAEKCTRCDICRIKCPEDAIEVT